MGAQPKSHSDEVVDLSQGCSWLKGGCEEDCVEDKEGVHVPGPDVVLQ